MPRFSTEFRGVEPETRQRLHAEAWNMFASRVDALVRSGADRFEAEHAALADAREEFIQNHPELPRDEWSFQLMPSDLLR